MSLKVILIGFMASGKSTLGKKLANKLGIPFIDSDSKIEELNSRFISEIFENDGEEVFRKMETDFILNYPFPDSFVLSTGGGMPCFNENISKLNEIGTTFYLKRPSKELVNRLLNAKDQRPLVSSKTEDELILYIDQMLEIRSVYYEQANFILDRADQTSDEIIELLKSVNK